MIKIGYWWSEFEPHLPHPKDLMDVQWFVQNQDIINKIKQYLDNGRVHARYKGFSYCRVCKEINGTEDLTDGIYVWRDGLSHYLEHNVRLPDEFVKHILKSHPADGC